VNFNENVAHGGTGQINEKQLKVYEFLLVPYPSCKSSNEQF